MSRSSMALMVPSVISSSYSLPVRLSVTLSDCLPPSTWPSALVWDSVFASGLIALLFAGPLRTTHFPPSVAPAVKAGTVGKLRAGRLAARTGGGDGAVAGLRRPHLGLGMAGQLVVA